MMDLTGGRGPQGERSDKPPTGANGRGQTGTVIADDRRWQCRSNPAEGAPACGSRGCQYCAWALRLRTCVTRSVTRWMGAERPTTVQNGGVDVFGRSGDHAGVSAESARAAWSLRIFISHFSLGPRALDERSAPERSDEVRSEA
jgi:hypothetical protein